MLSATPKHYVSHYLRPFRNAAGLFLDNGITAQQLRLSSLQQAVLQLLWPGEAPGPAAPAGAEERLEPAYRQYGRQAVAETLVKLASQKVLFADAAACDDCFRQLQQAPIEEAVPFIEQIELTTRCPMRCGFCVRGIPRAFTRPQGDMSLDLFEHLLAQLHPRQRHYRLLELNHMGESLLHPELPRFVAAAAQRGLPCELSCNPALLHPELAEALLAANVQRLVLSLDGDDADTLAAVRGPAADFERSLANIAALVELARRRAQPPQIVLQMIKLPENRHQQQAFLDRWSAESAPFFSAYLKEQESPYPGQSAPHAIDYLCTYPWHSVVVLWDGRVVPCCRDAAGDVILGYLTKQSLLDIWQGELANELRRMHRSGDFAAGHLCGRCTWLPKNFAAQLARRSLQRAPLAPLAW